MSPGLEAGRDELAVAMHPQVALGARDAEIEHSGDVLIDDLGGHLE